MENKNNYKAAGILLHHSTNRGTRILMGVGYDGLTILGGKREENEFDPIITAIREFDEETGETLTKNIINQLKDIIETSEQVKIVQFDGNYILYIVDITYTPEQFKNTVMSLHHLHKNWRDGASFYDARRCIKEMKKLIWLSSELFQTIKRVGRTPTYSKFLSRVITQNIEFMEWVNQVTIKIKQPIVRQPQIYQPIVHRASLLRPELNWSELQLSPQTSHSSRCIVVPTEKLAEYAIKEAFKHGVFDIQIIIRNE